MQKINIKLKENIKKKKMQNLQKYRAVETFESELLV